jgi:hypothetical protein
MVASFIGVLAVSRFRSGALAVAVVASLAGLSSSCAAPTVERARPLSARALDPLAVALDPAKPKSDRLAAVARVEGEQLEAVALLFRLRGYQFACEAHALYGPDDVEVGLAALRRVAPQGDGARKENVRALITVASIAMSGCSLKVKDEAWAILSRYEANAPEAIAKAFDSIYQWNKFEPTWFRDQLRRAPHPELVMRAIVLSESTALSRLLVPDGDPLDAPDELLEVYLARDGSGASSTLSMRKGFTRVALARLTDEKLCIRFIPGSNRELERAAVACLRSSAGLQSFVEVCLSKYPLLDRETQKACVPALAAIDDDALLARVATAAGVGPELQRAAIERVHSEEVLVRLAIEAGSAHAVRLLTSRAAAAVVLKSASKDEVRRTATLKHAALAPAVLGHYGALWPWIRSESSTQNYSGGGLVTSWCHTVSMERPQSRGAVAGRMFCSRGGAHEEEFFAGQRIKTYDAKVDLTLICRELLAPLGSDEVKALRADRDDVCLAQAARDLSALYERPAPRELARVARDYENQSYGLMALARLRDPKWLMPLVRGLGGRSRTLAEIQLALLDPTLTRHFGALSLSHSFEADRFLVTIRSSPSSGQAAEWKGVDLHQGAADVLRRLVSLLSPEERAVLAKKSSSAVLQSLAAEH